MHNHPKQPFPILLVACLVIPALISQPTFSAEPTPGKFSSTYTESPIRNKERRHWSFLPIANPKPPTVRMNNWPKNSIDRFILARLEDANLTPTRPADKLTLLRRVTFDLTGLPPTPAQQKTFLADTSPKAYEKVIDRLLKSPAYGQRWAQHWLDVARFAETDGFEHDKTRPNAWKFRDWVINALNNDLPLDQFIRLQIAADELKPNDPSAAPATGFLMAGPDMPDINSQIERRHTKLNEITSAVGQAFMGLTLQCAACHDHKFDPVSQADFYRLRAVFANILHPRNSRPFPTIVKEKSGKSPATHLMLRGDFRRKGQPLTPAFLRITNPNNQTLKPLTLKSSSGRRAAFANWLTSPNHPLTARVIVNRIWMHHFVNPLVATPNDFGTMGDPPTHPKLLDYLANHLIKSKWKLKAFHKFLLTSATYQQASRRSDNTRAATVDSKNKLLWRMNRRRLSGEEIRDTLLAITSHLSKRTGGIGVKPPLPREIASTLLKGQWKPSLDKADHTRRSIYIFARRNLRYPIFDTFDRPAADTSCARRARSVTAPQSLILLNSSLSLDSARRLAGRIFTTPNASTPIMRITIAYEFALSRKPTSSEITLATAFLIQQAKTLASSNRKPADLALPIPIPKSIPTSQAAAFTDLCLALFNLNEFIYVD